MTVLSSLVVWSLGCDNLIEFCLVCLLLSYELGELNSYLWLAWLLSIVFSRDRYSFYLNRGVMRFASSKVGFKDFKPSQITLHLPLRLCMEWLCGNVLYELGGQLSYLLSLPGWWVVKSFIALTMKYDIPKCWDFMDLPGMWPQTNPTYHFQPYRPESSRIHQQNIFSHNIDKLFLLCVK